MGWDAGSELLSLILWIWPLSTTLQSHSQRAQVQFGSETHKTKYGVEKKHFEMDADKSQTFAGAKENPFLQITIRNFRTEEKASQVLMGPLVPWMYWLATVITSLSCHYCHYSHIFLRSSTTMAGNIKFVWLQYTCRGRKLIHIQFMTTYLFH